MPKSRRNLAIRFIRTATDRELLDQVDTLVSDAVGGERRAIGAIAVAFGPLLLTELRRELGALFERDAANLLQQFLFEMLDRELAFPEVRGAAVPWMKRIVRLRARQHLRRHRVSSDLP